MPFFKRRPRPRKESAPARVFIEALESRELLSSTSTLQGYTPAEIRHAYGFDQISYSNGTVAADGSGQTIAIVDAYNDPNIFSDVQVFDSEFGIPSLSLTVVNQTGGTTLPSANAGWATEISLDVEWAHAIAPGAKILLVEANSESVSDLTSAVDYARNAAGVSVVSMSWGGSEFFSWNGGETSSQTNYDPYFTTPSGHQGVTFVAAAGDSGSSSGVQWPSSSPNVISVGGTTLTLDSNGNYVSESSWSGTSGGYSQVEAEPSYQNAVQSTGVRTTPDVAYNADPNTGFAVYDSLAYNGSSGWQEYGGTSAGAPQWAALIAIANQGRVIAGEGTLDGASQTLSIIYGLYAAPGSTGYSTYTSYFNDVVDLTTNNPWHWRFGGYGQSYSATTGYDLATGLGTPKTATIVGALVASSSTGTGNGTGSGSGSGSGGGTTTTQQLAASPFNAVFTRTPDPSAVDGQSGTAKLMLTNTSGSNFSGPVTIDEYASSDATLTSNDTLVGTVTFSKLKIAAGASLTRKVRFTYPTTLTSGSYYLIASVDATSLSNTANATAVTPTQVEVTALRVDLAATFAATEPVTVKPGWQRTVAVVVKNVGNVTASGSINVNLYAAAGSTIDSAARLLSGTISRRIKLKAGTSITVYITFTAPSDQTVGSYNLLASLTSATQIEDTNASNDVAVIGTRST